MLFIVIRIMVSLMKNGSSCIKVETSKYFKSCLWLYKVRLFLCSFFFAFLVFGTMLYYNINI